MINHEEGWGVFNIDNSTPPKLEIQMLEGSGFKCDAEAATHVFYRAAEGSMPHMKAVVDVLLSGDPGRAEDLCDHISLGFGFGGALWFDSDIRGEIKTMFPGIMEPSEEFIGLVKSSRAWREEMKEAVLDSGLKILGDAIDEAFAETDEAAYSLSSIYPEDQFAVVYVSDPAEVAKMLSYISPQYQGRRPIENGFYLLAEYPAAAAGKEAVVVCKQDLVYKLVCGEVDEWNEKSGFRYDQRGFLVLRNDIDAGV